MIGTEERSHVERIRGVLQQTARNVRESVEHVTDQRAKAMFESTAEVLDGLVKTYNDYEASEEAAWR